MQLHFDANQFFQLDAIAAVTDIFEGQPLQGDDFGFSLETAGARFSELGVGNRLDIGEEEILRNVRAIQGRNKIEPASQTLQGMDFSVEMETGTGKTYVYLRTVYELNRLYCFKKFVIVVPSIAIREGVLKNLEITHGHFQLIYNKVLLGFKVYGAKKVSSLRQFAQSNAIEVLILNIDSFAKDENVINRPNDKLSGRQPVEFIRATHPIVIVDEPQNMETEKRRRAIQSLNPLCTLRYSATHTNLYNQVYSLNPVRAYDMGLVKQIEVYSIVAEQSMNDAFVKLEEVRHKDRGKSAIVAKVLLDVNTPKGVQRKAVTVDRNNRDLLALSKGREMYRDMYVNEIDAVDKYISLSNGLRLSIGQATGAPTDEIQREMMRRAVQEHLKKEIKYAQAGIKVLTLFFIDRVKNYRDHDAPDSPAPGKFARWFEEIYQEEVAKPANAPLNRFDVSEVHGGYFSKDSKGKFKDSRGESEDDFSTYQTIMRDKEHLLDMDTPLRFIFSHSALREGWDNPNVFQICTLNETKSDLKKRQEIGRGLRLCVDGTGMRRHEREINRLTVIANESYEDFAKALQNEIETECGVAFTGRVKNARERRQVLYRKGFELDAKFIEIWDRIKQKTKYRVSFDTNKLIERAAEAVKKMPTINPPWLRSTRTAVNITEDGISGTLVSEPIPVVYGLDGQDGQADTVLPDALSYIQDKTCLTRSTVFEIIKQSRRVKDFLTNPQLFMDSALSAIKNTLHDIIRDGVEYKKIDGNWYEMTIFDDTNLVFYKDDNTFTISDLGKTIYENYIPLDSSVENDFARDCENSEDVDFFFKLPSKFTIPTPVGNYNPDWAVVFKGEKKLYFIAETKGKNQELRPSEAQKIDFGRAYCQALEDVGFGQVSSVGELAGLGARG